ncbi:Apolipoprotein N-acyltransferase [Prochlorococcus sp. MIT 0602]|nr:Apolipoprotein N-acyltransferase [Prochlorococcus sp. MIT 0602]
MVAFALSLIWGLSEVLLAKSPLFLFGISSSLLPQDRWLAGLARWFGAGGLTALQLLLGWWIWQIALALKKRHSILRLFTWGVFVLVISHYLGWSLISINNYSFTKRIALWQTNVPIKEKFSSSHLKDLPTAIDDALNEAKKTGSEWLVAPEGTLLADQTLLSPAVIPFLSGGFRWVDGKQRSSLLVFNTGSSSFNEAIDKYRLVPLGEWIPKLPSFAFKGLSLVGGLDPGQSSRFLKWEGPPAGVAICYELSDGKSLAKAANKGAQWILSIANLDPYPISLQKQFISLAQLRGIELARDVISVANTGPTSLINSSGQVKQVVVPFIKGVGTVEVSFSNQISGYSRWGELPMIFGLIVAIFEITRLKEKSEYVG